MHLLHLLTSLPQSCSGLPLLEESNGTVLTRIRLALPDFVPSIHSNTIVEALHLLLAAAPHRHDLLRGARLLQVDRC